MVKPIMGMLKWYKRDPHRAVVGMTGLTLEEVGAYNLLLDWMYIRDGKLPDDSRTICNFLHTKPQRWRRLRTALITKKKIYVLGGFLRNERTDREITTVAAKARRKFQQRAARRMNGNGAHYDQ
jgi:uncharacterized protein YdaU (DUF1376 family)